MAETSDSFRQPDLRYVSDPELLTCTCCRKLIRDCPEENSDYGIWPRLRDTGFGTCIECGGDPNSKSFRKQLGWAGRTFYEARFNVLRDALSEERRAKFDSLPYWKKVAVIGRLIERGAMI